MLPDRSLHEGSQNRQRETLGCDAVATQVSANPTGCYEAGVALQRCPKLRSGGPSLYTPVTSHWMPLPLGKRWALRKWLFSAQAIPEEGFK